MADQQGHTFGSWIAGLLARVGHLWVENPVRLVTFAWELLVACINGLRTPARTTRTAFAAQFVRQILRTLVRTFVPTLAVGLILALALGRVVGAFGDVLRILFDNAALSMLMHQVLPLVLAILLIARVGSAIAGKFMMWYVAHPPARPASPTERGIPGDLSTPRGLLREVVPLVAATAVTAAALYWVLAVTLVAGYLTDGFALRIGALGFSGITDFIRTRNLSGEMLAAMWRSVLFGLAAAHIAAALGVTIGRRVGVVIAARQRASEIQGGAPGEAIVDERELVDDELEESEYYAPVWESGVTSLMICAALTALFWSSQWL